MHADVDEGGNVMGKIMTAEKIKKLPPGTDVTLVREATGETGRLWVVKSGRKKMLRGAVAMHEIKDRPGWHYEVEEREKM